MKNNLFIIVSIISLFCSTLVNAQLAGTRNYALGGSSVMYSPLSSALFLNPGEIARVHYDEIFISSDKFTGLSQLSASKFFPYVGTFAVGVGNEFQTTQYSFGYAKVMYDRQTIGAAINYLNGPVSKDITLSLGTTWHFPESDGMNSGLLLGASTVNFSSNTSLPGQRFSAGAGYWALPNKFRVQLSWLYEGKESYVPLGGEYTVTPDFAVQAGTKSFKDFSAGLSYTLPTMNLDFALGKEAVSFSVSFRWGDDIRTIRDNYYQEGIKLYGRGSYPEAREAFNNALQYDEYFEAARTYVELSQGVTETSTQILIRDAQKDEEEGKILDAKKNYTSVLKDYPNDPIAKSRLEALQPLLHTQALKIALNADSLMTAANYDSAREQYLLAFEYDPNNEEILKHLSTMEKMIADSVAFYLDKGNQEFSKNQYDAALASYERVLEYNSDNPEAELNIETVKAKRKAAALAAKTQRISKESLDKGKTAFDSKNYFDAIGFFSDYLKIDPKNKEAQDYLDHSRDSLKPQIENYFKLGLQYYVDENYKQALEIWNKALIINPEHQAILEYKKRAELKIEALEKLK